MQFKRGEFDEELKKKSLLMEKSKFKVELWRPSRIC